MSEATSPERKGLSREYPAVWGYATHSRRSALVMKLVDILPNLRRPVESFLQEGCVISSLAGLGDLMIQLPLISGLVEKARRSGLEPQVALRPAHVPIGKACGWNVLPFENPLIPFFGPGISRKLLAEAMDTLKQLRQKKTSCWVDLTGNAFNAVALRLAGVRCLYSKTTRGGKSLVDSVIPHFPYQNEYEWRQNVARHFDSDLDLTIYERLSPIRIGKDIVLAVTTGARWKSWPLKSFKAVVDAFPEQSFILVGSTREILPEEKATWEQLVSLPNVHNKLDKLNTLELVQCVAESAAFVGNDSGTSHIANAFAKPGAVIFGPTISETWHGPSALRLFHDQSCAFYPCVLWTCRQPDEWCMKKTTPTEVINHLENILRNASSPSTDSLSRK